MTWNVYRYDPNTHKFEPYNIFTKNFITDIQTFYTTCRDREAFNAQLRDTLLYHFWKKCEWECLLSSWPESGNSIKIDAYDQIMLNFDKFSTYCWDECSRKK